MGTIYDVPKGSGQAGETHLAYVAKDGIDKPGYFIMIGGQETSGRNAGAASGPYRTEQEAQDALDALADENGWRYSAAWN